MVVVDWAEIQCYTIGSRTHFLQPVIIIIVIKIRRPGDKERIKETRRLEPGLEETRSVTACLHSHVLVKYGDHQMCLIKSSGTMAGNYVSRTSCPRI